MSAACFRDADRALLPLIRPAIGLCLAALLYVPTAVTAEEKTPAEPTQLDKVVVTGEKEAPYTVEQTGAATKLQLSPRETPQSVTVITRERMEDQNMQSLRDVLDNTTGVYSYAYDSERVVFTSRGFIIDSTLYDGVPVAPGLNTGAADASLDTALYERIEVVRGATGLLSGAGNPAASINLVRKRADSKTFEASTGLSLGSWNDYRAEADVSTPLTADGSVRGRVVGVFQDRDSYIDLYHYRKKVLYGTVDANLGANALLTVGYEYQETSPEANTWGSFPLFYSDGTRTDWPRSKTSAAEWSRWNNKTQTAFADLRYDLGKDWSLRSVFTHRELDSDPSLFYVEGFVDKETGEGLTAYTFISRGHVQQNAVDLFLSGTFESFGRRHELVIGFNGSQVTGGEFGHEPPADYEAPPVGDFIHWNGQYPRPPVTGDVIQNVATDIAQNGLYAVARFSLADPLKLIVGARYSDWKSDGFDYSPQSKYAHKETTPYAGLIYDLSKTYSAFASYTEIFDPQDYRDSNGRYLDPVTGKSQEIGIKGEHFGGRLNTALTLFDTRQDNVGVPVEPAEYLPPPNDLVQIYTAVDGTKTRGFELEANGQLMKNWNLSFGWSHYRLEDADGERIKGYMPSTLVRLFSTWKPIDRLTVGGGLNWQSSNFLDVASPDPSGATRVEQSAVTLLNLLARYEFTPQLSVQLNAENLIDKKYYVIDEYSNLYYGEPINATLGVSYRF